MSMHVCKLYCVLEKEGNNMTFVYFVISNKFLLLNLSKTNLHIRKYVGIITALTLLVTSEYYQRPIYT
jgi:hypothetical protein